MTRSSRSARFEHDIDEVRSATKKLAVNTIESAREAATEMLDEGKAKAATAAAAAQDRLQQRPLRTLLVAAGLGFVVGFLARRR
jgi:ElaB/YqjD/DUF883 family membrane-anchored ribosome-binding protein